MTTYAMEANSLEILFFKSSRKISETGILSYYSKVWYGTRPKCGISELMVAPVDIAHFSSAMYIVVIGIFSSLTVLIVEIIVHRLSKRRVRLIQLVKLVVDK